MCQSSLLSSNGQTTITYCPVCKTHYIWHHSFLLALDAMQYNAFRSAVFKHKGKEAFFNGPDGTQRLMLPTPLPELNFTFSYPEWHNFVLSLEESAYMMEVYQLIDHPH